MKEIVIYLLKASVFISVFWTVYRFYLRRESFFVFNRVFLLSGIVAAFALPAARLSYTVKIPYVASRFYGSVTVITDESAYAAGGFDPERLWLAAAVLYAAGVVFFILRNINVGRKVGRILRRSTGRRVERCVVVDDERVESPFTFANYIFMNGSNMSEVERDIILRHEASHIRQRHWIDIAAGETMLALQWFNPLAWRYVSAMKENHEFLADRAVIDSGVDTTLYSQVLVNQTFRAQIFSFSTFSLRNNSKRLAMLKKGRSMNWKKAAVLALVPVFALFLKANAVPEYVYYEPLVAEDILPAAEESPESTAIYEGQDPVKGTAGTATGGKTAPPSTEKTAGTATIGKDVASVISNIGAEKSLYVIDGKESTIEELVKLSNDITFIAVLREARVAIRGNEGKNDVVVAFTKSKENAKTEIDVGKVLFVIDGEESTAEVFAELKSDDIENIIVLKDATAAIYGSKGKNGAVVVFTKSAGNSADE